MHAVYALWPTIKLHETIVVRCVFTLFNTMLKHSICTLWVAILAGLCTSCHTLPFIVWLFCTEIYITLHFYVIDKSHSSNITNHFTIKVNTAFKTPCDWLKVVLISDVYNGVAARVFTADEQLVWSDCVPQRSLTQPQPRFKVVRCSRFLNKVFYYFKFLW